MSKTTKIVNIFGGSTLAGGSDVSIVFYFS